MPRAKHAPIDHLALRKARRAAGLTRDELAEKASTEAVPISSSSLQTYEAGTHAPSPEKLEALAKVLKCRPESLAPPTEGAPATDRMVR